MALIRLIMLAFVVWIGWRMLKNFQLSQKRKTKSKTITKENMVICSQCQVYLPQEDAIAEQKLWFCSADHKKTYLSVNKQ